MSRRAASKSARSRSMRLTKPTTGRPSSAARAHIFSASTRSSPAAGASTKTTPVQARMQLRASGRKFA